MSCVRQSAGTGREEEEEEEILFLFFIFYFYFIIMDTCASRGNRLCSEKSMGCRKSHSVTPILVAVCKMILKSLYYQLIAPFLKLTLMI